MIYINGRKASKNDITRLLQDLQKGRATLLNIRKTKAGATALTVEA